MAKRGIGTILATAGVCYALVNFAAPESGTVIKQRATSTADNVGEMMSVGGQNLIWTGSDWVAAGRGALAENSDLLTGAPSTATTAADGTYPTHP